MFPVAIAVLTPITEPFAASSGPPEFPLLIDASVWMTSSIVNSFGAVSGRWSALTIPAVTLRSRPSGFPIATTESPTRIRSEFPSSSGRRARESTFTFRRARSVDGSVPTTRARTLSRLEKLTSICSAPSTTWKLVTIRPAVSITKPEPSAC